MVINFFFLNSNIQTHFLSKIARDITHFKHILKQIIVIQFQLFNWPKKMQLIP